MVLAEERSNSNKVSIVFCRFDWWLFFFRKGVCEEPLLLLEVIFIPESKGNLSQPDHFLIKLTQHSMIKLDTLKIS